MPIEKFTEAKCRRYNGEIIERKLRDGHEVQICIIDIDKHPELALPWQKKGKRAIILGLE